MSELKSNPPTPATGRHYWTPLHVISVLAAFAVCIVVFRYTGDSEPFLAIGSGASIAIVAWVLNHLHWRQSNRAR